jgi:uncharacterized membrane protein YdjX (TVP38/TMEM64 family)
MNTKEPSKSAASKVKMLIFIAVILALIGAAKYFHIQELFRRALEGIASLGAWGPILYIAIYILGCLLFFPGSVLTLSGAALFGFIQGAILVSISATLGATCAFLVGRHLARDWVAKKIQANEKFKAIDEAVAREGWKIVILTRLSPVFPFNLQNYAYGLTQVSLRDYFFASWLGMLPGTILYVYIGSLAGEVAQIGGGGKARTPAEWAFLLVGLAATVGVTVYITRIARAALKKKV